MARLLLSAAWVAFQFAILILAASCPLRAAEPGPMDVFVSTGDNHFLGSSLPIDSPASIEATLDLLKNVNHTRRIYWRGLEEACWVANMHARSENCRYYSLWQWMQTLYAEVKPDVVAVRAAHARGLEIWGVGSLWDWGSPADTPTFGDYPFPFEARLKLDHPEWAAVDRHGVRRQGGPIELAYPQARQALVELIVRETLAAGYDGITLLTYVENYSLRFQDEFGFSEPIVRDFKKLHGIDLAREPFRRGASREDWLRLRGSYVTSFLRELKTELDKHRVKLGMIVNPNDIHAPLPWNVPELMLTAGSHYMDVETWIRDGLVDSLCVYGNSSRLAQADAIQRLQFLCRGAKCEMAFMTSSPLAPDWSAVQQSGVATVLAVSDDAQHLARGFVPEQTTAALRGDDLWKRLRVLQQIVDGKLQGNVDDLAPLAKSANLIERRMALQALAASGGGDAIMRAALDDPENGVRCVAALTLGQRHDPAACQPLLAAVAQHGNHMLVECVVIALRKLTPLPVDLLEKAVRDDKHDRVPEVAIRALQPNATAAMIPTLTAGLTDSQRFVRYVAADALGNVRKSPAAAEALLAALGHDDPVVVNRAAVSLGTIVARREAELASLRTKILTGLETAFRRHGAGSMRSDADWGYRPVGNALRACGDDGAAVLRRLRDQHDDPRLAELAWRVLELHQQPNTFSEVSAAENEAAFALRPGRQVANGDEAAGLHVDPVAGNDSNDGRGKPVKTIARAIRLAQPGDVVHLAPARYYESADLTNKHGEPGRPITLDGHGAVLDGSEPVRAADWESLGEGLFRRVKLLPRVDDAMIGRWFFLWDGKMNHMGRTSKGPSAALKKSAELQPGEWTYIKDEDAFYIRLEPGQTLDAAKIRYPARSSAVIEGLSGSHLFVKNVIGTHVYNDGYNIHGTQRDCTFENIAAIECGDDGFSAHEDAECRIDGFVSIGNSTGMCDTVSSVTHFKNVFIKDCLGYDVYFIGDSPHSIENGWIESSAARAFDAAQHTDRPQVDVCTVRLKNVYFHRVGSPQELRISRNSRVAVDRCTFLGLNVLVSSGGELSAKQCLFAGQPQPEILLFANTLWRGDGNLLDVKSLRQDKTTYTEKTFVDFQRASGSDKNSKWQSAPADGRLADADAADAGADIARLEVLKQKASETVKRWQQMQ